MIARKHDFILAWRFAQFSAAKKKKATAAALVASMSVEGLPYAKTPIALQARVFSFRRLTNFCRMSAARSFLKRWQAQILAIRTLRKKGPRT